MPDMPDSGVDESQVENNENIEKYRPSSIIKKSLSWKLKVEKWKSESVCEHKRTEHVKKQK